VCMNPITHSNGIKSHSKLFMNMKHMNKKLK